MSSTVNHGVLTKSLVDCVKTVPAYEGRVSMAIGAKAGDPFLYRNPYPVAWVTFIGDENVAQDQEGECSVIVRARFVVKVIIEYGSATELATENYPVLGDTILSVLGTTPIENYTGYWRYDGQAIAAIEDGRIEFDQSYSVQFTIR